MKIKSLDQLKGISDETLDNCTEDEINRLTEILDGTAAQVNEIVGDALKRKAEQIGFKGPRI